ncbi:hypothetical protein [Natronorubrum sp. FCH18a]
MSADRTRVILAESIADDVERFAHERLERERDRDEKADAGL